MASNLPHLPSSFPDSGLPSPRHYIAPDPVADNTRSIDRALKDEAERAAAHRQQVQADSELARSRGEQALKFARWTLVVAALTLIVAVATLIVSVALG